MDWRNDLLSAKFYVIGGSTPSSIQKIRIHRAYRGMSLDIRIPVIGDLY